MTDRTADRDRGLPLAPGAPWLALLPIALCLPLALFSVPLALGLGVLGAVAVLWFHRDPARSIPAGDAVLAPADGRVTVRRTTDDGRARVGIFMSPFDVHVNRAPTSMDLEAVDHEPGAHRPAFSKDSDRNERVHLVGDGYRVVLIAGAFARRIHPYVEAGESVRRGERIGHISFGSRVDVVFPPDVDLDEVEVEEGTSVKAGETVLLRPD